MTEILSHREKEVLKYIVENFIISALPVGSRSVSKQTDLKVSSATIRNVMSDLEDMDLLSTPHTSAGRVPTDKGYRYYIDTLMNQKSLNEKEINFLKSKIEEKKSKVIENEELYIETSRILGKISHQLAIVTQPFLITGIFKKLELVSLSSNKILVIISIKSGFVRTVIMEIDSEISRAELDKLTSFLNEKLQGLTLKEIRETFSERVKDYNTQKPELIKLFVNSIDKLYSEEEKGGRIYIAGTGEIILQPEFDDPQNFKKIVELTEDKDLVVQVFQNTAGDDTISISIGAENTEKKLKDYSVVCTTYNFGDVKGNIGIIGPKRMNYAKMISLLDYTSKLITDLNS